MIHARLDGTGVEPKVEINTTTMSQLSLGEIGVGESGGATAITIYEPAFSNAYFTNPASGVITACGTGTA